MKPMMKAVNVAPVIVLPLLSAIVPATTRIAAEKTIAMKVYSVTLPPPTRSASFPP